MKYLLPFKWNQTILDVNWERGVQKTTNNNVFKKYTLLVAINYKGVIGWTLYKEGGITAEKLILFLDKCNRNMD